MRSRGDGERAGRGRGKAVSASAGGSAPRATRTTAAADSDAGNGQGAGGLAGGVRDNLPARVQLAAHRDGLPRGATVLVAVSGGVDSVVLLDCLARVAGALALRVVVGHVDHGIRRDSGLDAGFVAGLAAARGLDFRVRTTDVRGVAHARGWTLEEAGRAERYRLLGEMAREVGADRIATAHTASDQAETVLMRLVRGTGPLGLAGIDAGAAGASGSASADVRCRAGSSDPAARPWRPLLGTPRDEVLAWARSAGLAWREDPTNADPRHLRNRIRRDVMPVLRALNPRVDLVLAALAEDAAALAAWVRDRAGDGVTREPAGRGSAGGTSASPEGAWRVAAGIDALSPYRVLLAFERVTGAPLGLTRRHVQAVVRLAAPGAAGEAHLPRRVVARSDGRGVVLSRDLEGPPPGSARRGHRGR